MRILNLAYMFFRQQLRHRVQVVVVVFAAIIILAAMIFSSLAWKHEGELVAQGTPREIFADSLLLDRIA